jgi:hypothetical protein
MKQLHESARRIMSMAAAFISLQQAPDAHLDRSVVNSLPPMAPPAAAPAKRAVHRSTGEGWVSYQRFWRNDGNTLIDAMIRVPPLAGSGQQLETTVSVLDSFGNTLLQETWVDSAAVQGAGSDHEFAVPVRFVLANGTYRMSVRARRGAAADSGSIEMQAFPMRPLSSDLILSPSVRPVKHNEKVALPEIAHGDYAVQSWPHAVHDPEHPQTFYYLELYPAPEEIGTDVKLSFDIVRLRDNKKFKGSEARVKQLKDPLHVDFGQLGLEGFAAGEYRLDVSIQAPGRKEIRQAYFTVAS